MPRPATNTACGMNVEVYNRRIARFEEPGALEDVPVCLAVRTPNALRV